VPVTDTETHKAIARRFAERLFNHGDAAAYDELVADGYVHHNPPIPGVPGTKDGFWQAVVLTRKAFPDVHVEIQDVLAEGDRVLFRDVAKATHAGDFLGIPATGRALSWTEMHLLRIANGRVIEHWTNFDQLGILVQMGVVPGTPG
jgi:steroid delta-isomerase-like uncharacterized protein